MKASNKVYLIMVLRIIEYSKLRRAARDAAPAQVQPRIPAPLSQWIGISALVLGFLITWIVLFGLLARNPAMSLSEAQGLYQIEGGDRPFQWTSSRVQIPISNHAGSTRLDLILAAQHLPNNPMPQVRVETNAGTRALFPVVEQVRHYQLLLPPAANEVQLYAPLTFVAKPPHRWIGIQIYGLRAVADGFPTAAARRSLLIALAGVLIAACNLWAWRRGYGAVVTITLLALAVRCVRLGAMPAGFHQDEVVSVVDAWHLARTGHDHLGHFLPLAALESFGDWVSPLLAYLELPGVALFGPHILLGRLVTVLIGALAVPICYAIARSLRLPTHAAALVGLVVALSPWQIALARVAIPPALVPTCWALCLWAGLRLVQRGERRDALVLAAAAGIALYAYPTMKMVVPLLVALSVVLALYCHGWRRSKHWLLPAMVLAILWLPFVALTFFNAASGTRLNQALLQADSPAMWLAEWWRNYRFYFQPGFYYSQGDYHTLGGPSNWGMALTAEAPLVLLGFALLVWRCLKGPQFSVLGSRFSVLGSQPSARATTIEWLLLAGALLLAPLPSSVTSPVPHALRAATIMPIYALLVGLGANGLWAAGVRVGNAMWWRIVKGVAVGVYVGLLTYQSGSWFNAYLHNAPETTYLYQDGLLDAMERATQYAPSYGDVWIDTHHMAEPHIYVLAAQPFSPAESQAKTVITRQPPDFNKVWQIEHYHFAEHPPGIPDNLPTLDVVLDSFGHPQYVVQEWLYASQRTLVVRRVESVSP